MDSIRTGSSPPAGMPGVCTKTDECVIVRKIFFKTVFISSQKKSEPGGKAIRDFPALFPARVP
jgi:hypothetical protein